jgi:hypothetical protein
MADNSFPPRDPSELDVLNLLRPSWYGTPTLRLDGRVELTCAHGTGHPSRLLQWMLGRRRWHTADAVHGCCGCCNLDPDLFYDVEFDVASRWERARAARRLLDRNLARKHRH